MGFINSVLKGIGTGLKKFITDDPNLYVETAEEGLTTSGVVAVKNGNMSKAEVAELMRALRENERDAERVNKRIENGVKLTPSDKTDFRDDKTMEAVKESNVSVRPAGELPNHERAAVGRERDSKMK